MVFPPAGARGTVSGNRPGCYRGVYGGSIGLVKLSVSLPEDDVDFLDSYVATQGLASRSAAVHTAVRLLKAAELAGAYTAAWDEFAASGEGEAWAPSVGDGLDS